MRNCLSLLYTIFVTLSLIDNIVPLSIDCWFGSINYWSVIHEGTGCVMYDIRGAKNVKETITNVTGTLSEGTTFKDIKVVDMRGFCNFIPDGFDKYFENLEGFSSYNTSMLTVSSADLKQFPKLREIWVYYNLLEYLPSNLFEYNPNIEFIHFQQNKIKYIDPEFFTKIPKLIGAKFGGNECIDRNVSEVEYLILLKREIKKKCSSKAGPNEISQETASLQIDFLYLEIVKLEKEITMLKEVNKNICLAKPLAK